MQTDLDTKRYTCVCRDMWGPFTKVLKVSSPPFKIDNQLVILGGGRKTIRGLPVLSIHMNVHVYTHKP